MNIPHDNSAKYYDFVFQNRFGNAYNNLTQQNISKITENTPENGKILDFGAGTGRISIPLAKGGYEVTAVDSSSEMLGELRRKAQTQQLNINTYSELPNNISENFDMAIAIFTVLAYIIEQSELETVFQNIYNSLKPGGFFMFDLEKRDGYYRIWRDNNGIVSNKQNDDFNDCVTVNFQDNDSILCNYHEEVRGTLNGEEFDYTESFVIKFWGINEILKIAEQIGFTKTDEFQVGYTADYFILKK